MKSIKRFDRSEIMLLAILVLFAISCSRKFIKNKEAREDAAEYSASVTAQRGIRHIIYPSIETAPVKSVSPTSDSADDPAIWYNEVDPSMSVVYGSNKTAGIHSYDLEGQELQFIACGEINNVDVRKGVRFGGNIIDILGGSNRTDNSIDLFAIDEQGMLDTNLVGKILLGEFKPYGFCLGKSSDNLLHIYVNDKHGALHHLSVDATGDLGSLGKRVLKFSSQLEGMVVHDQSGTLYIGEEQKGIWICDAFDIKNQKKDFIDDSADTNPDIRYDIEGLALLPPHYLVASSQGNFSFAIFDRMTKSYVTSFKINNVSSIDAVEETDGIEILASSLSNVFDSGILVVQDGFNYQDSILLRQNFKYVDLSRVLNLLK